MHRQKSVSWKIAEVVPYALTTYNEQSWLEIKALFSNDSINLTLFSMRKITAFLILALLGAPLLVQAETPARQHLFKIERSKNANIVQYDAQIGTRRKADEKGTRCWLLGSPGRTGAGTEAQLDTENICLWI